MVAEAPLVEMAEAEEAVMARLASKGRPRITVDWAAAKLPRQPRQSASPSPLGLVMARRALRRQDRSLT